MSHYRRLLPLAAIAPFALLSAQISAQQSDATKVGARSNVPPAIVAICLACHSVSADGASGMGPNLRGIVGRRAGTATGFPYSSAIRESGITWTAAELDVYLTAPALKVPGTMMAFDGIADPAQRQSVIAYLRTLR
jgi:cytochrome c